MKAKFGAIVVDGRGKIGGHVASKYRAGAYFRAKVSPSQPVSLYGANVRARLSSISQSWHGLASSARKVWNGAEADGYVLSLILLAISFVIAITLI